MSRRLLWELCLIFVTGVVAMFYSLDYLASKAEDSMSYVAPHHREELKRWGEELGEIYRQGDTQALENWLEGLQSREDTAAAIVRFETQHIVEGQLREEHYSGFNFGRSVDWPIHLYFEENPVMEIPLAEENISFIVRLPDRMRPGSLWSTTRIVLQIALPMALLAILALLLYRHIMKPLNILQRATREFTQGNLSVRVKNLLGTRNDELSDLANTFDQMAERIGKQIMSQRQLIADMSHELRTPLTRMDIALEGARSEFGKSDSIDRALTESQQIRCLVNDTLTLAWLENECPQLTQEDLDLVDLVNVIVDDAAFEFPTRQVTTELPDSALLQDSNHRAVGQALENVVRNALRYSPEGETVNISLTSTAQQEYLLVVKDCGLGVPRELLELIFEPFFRVDKARSLGGNSFGLGLALARRQLAAVGGSISAANGVDGGLLMTITLPAKLEVA